MTTNNKAFKEQVQQHILEGLSEDYGNEPKEQLQATVDGFKNWYGPYEQKHNPNRQTAFMEWLNGLPSELNIEYTHYGINKTLSSWFENAGETYKERDSDKESALYRALYYREFSKLCRKEGVKL